MFPPLTPESKQIVVDAAAIADEGGGDAIEAEHILLALLARPPLVLRPFAESIGTVEVGASPLPLSPNLEAEFAAVWASPGSTPIHRLFLDAWLDNARPSYKIAVTPERLVVGLFKAAVELPVTLRERDLDIDKIREAVEPGRLGALGTSQESTEGSNKSAPEEAADAPFPTIGDILSDESPPWSRLSKNSRLVLTLAEESARSRGDHTVLTEHLLLGIVGLADRTVLELFAHFDVTIEEIAERIEGLHAIVEVVPGGDLTLSPTGFAALAVSQEEADRLGDDAVDCAHVLLGLIRVRSGTAGAVLAELGIKVELARLCVQYLRQPDAEEEPGEPVRPMQLPGRVRREKSDTKSSGGTQIMWQRFTERARKVVFYAQEEAGKLGENYVSTEHLLLGLVRDNDSVAARILDRLGLSLGRVRSEIERQVTHGEGRLGQDMQLTPRAKRVIDLAYDEARQLYNNYIGTEHLLLGLIREGEGLAGRVLVKLGADLDRTRREITMLQDGPDGSKREQTESVVPAINLSDEVVALIANASERARLNLRPRVELADIAWALTQDKVMALVYDGLQRVRWELEEIAAKPVESTPEVREPNASGGAVAEEPDSATDSSDSQDTSTG